MTISLLFVAVGVLAALCLWPLLRGRTSSDRIELGLDEPGQSGERRKPEA